MKFGYIIVIVLLLLSASFFGAYFGTQKEKVVEKNVCQYDKDSSMIKDSIPIKVESTTTISTIPTPTPNKKFEGRWGGIALSKNVYPVGTTYNPTESSRYEVPVATGEGLWYIFLDGYWFTKEEYDSLPYDIRASKRSPYIWTD